MQDPRERVAAWCQGTACQCVEDELPQNTLPQREVPLRGTFILIQQDQAARVFDSLAWSFSLKSLFEAINVFDVTRHPILR